MINIKKRLNYKDWPLILMFMSFIIPVTMGHYLYKNNYLFELGNVSHGKILQEKVYAEVNGKRIYKWTILKVGSADKNYQDLKNQQIFYNSRILLNKNKKKIDNIYEDLSNIVLEKKKINSNILKKDNILIIDPNSNVIMQFDSSVNLKYVISDIKRLLKYARF